MAMRPASVEPPFKKGDLVRAPEFVKIGENSVGKVMTLGIYMDVDPRNSQRIRIKNLLPHENTVEEGNSFIVAGGDVEGYYKTPTGFVEGYGSLDDQRGCIHKATPLDVLLLNSLKSQGLLGATPDLIVTSDNYNEMMSTLTDSVRQDGGGNKPNRKRSKKKRRKSNRR